MKPLVSIIIPIFNAEETITVTLNNILCQTYPNFEIIVIDDSSTDASSSKVKWYLRKRKKQYSNVTLLSTSGEGLSYSVNLGLKYATGKYVMFFKSGNIMSNNLLEYMVNLAQKYDSGIISCDYFDIVESDLFKQTFHIPQNPKQIIYEKTPKEYLKKLSSYKKHTFIRTYSLWNKLIPKSILTDFSFQENIFNFDMYSIREIINRTNKIILSNQLLIANTLLDNYFEERCFKYTDIEKIDFLQNLLVEAHKNNDLNSVKNISINLINTLCDIRKTLAYYYLEIEDLEEQKRKIDLKFNSLYKYLNKSLPKIAVSYKYKNYFTRYKEIVETDKFREKYYAIFNHPPKTMDIYLTEVDDLGIF